MTDENIAADYIPNTTTSIEDAVKQYGKNVLSDGRLAPTLMVIYQCPKCKFIATLDAYDGPPSCLGDGELVDDKPHRSVSLVPLRLAYEQVL